MTPLARELVEAKLLPVPQRAKRFADPDGILPKLQDFHCFETTKITGLRFELQNKIAEMHKANEHHEIQRLVFLPAPRTWLERKEFGFRSAYFLVEWRGGAGFDAFICGSRGGDLIGRVRGHDPFGIVTPPRWVPGVHYDRETGRQYVSGHIGDIVSQLVLINSPHVVGRQQFMPDRSLERRLTERLGRGKFPLHAWTEIKLEVAKPIEIDDGEPHEAHLTGRRALHFVRKHIRIRLGKLEYVSAHWRGDAAIGIKQSRYAVQP